MTAVLNGVKVLELATWTFVPAAGAVLSDWGADVIKVEHAETGDPQRGLSVGNLSAAGSDSVSYIFEQPNRGKRSFGLNVSTEKGRELLLELAKKCDVFITNLLPESLERARLTVEDLRAANPKIIYARGTGQGVRGPDANKAGYDGTAYMARGGVAHLLKAEDSDWPALQRPALGDIVGGFAIAAGIAAALYRRAETGEPSVVDVSLLGLAAWQLSPDLVAADMLGPENVPVFSVNDRPNPLVGYYRTSDGRFLNLVMLQADRFWPEVCELLERPDLLTDERFATAPARYENRGACIEQLRAAFATRPLAQWRERMEGLKGAWAVVQTPGEILVDPQVEANGYLRPVEYPDAVTHHLVANPVQFDETPPELVRAPAMGQHTDEILENDLGLDWDTIIALKVDSVVN